MRKSKNPVSLARKKCDKALQEEGHRRYKVCEICGKPMQCLHHFFPKSISSRLRYEWDNLIPICNSCHFKHHSTFDPSIHATVIKKRGRRWYNKLEKIKREYIKTDIHYYKQMLITIKDETIKQN